MFKNLSKLVTMPSTLFITMGIVTMSFADDTELYSATYAAGTTGKPKVLVVFDDSGSMNEVVEGVKPAYDPNGTYVQKVAPNRIYWSTGGTPPNVNNYNQRNQWFPASSNSCASSSTPLSTVGTYSSAAKRWQEANGSIQQVCTRYRRNGTCRRWASEWVGDEAGWMDLSANVNDPYTVDCYQDTAQPNPNPLNASPIANGYPRSEAAPDTPTANAYTANVGQSNVNWGSAYTFYTSHYMDWYYDDTIVPEDKDYLQIAQEVIESIVRANPGIDFGLAVFNNNSSGSSTQNGGRVVKRIVKNMTLADRNSLINTLWQFDHAGNTPLCETAWEAYLYMTGGRPLYSVSSYSGDVPLRDNAAISGGNYISPIEECTNTYIIFMTDGLPTSDNAANSLITGLPGVPNTCPTYGSGYSSFSSCLAPLTKYMAEKDLDGDASNGFQTVKTATIGFNVESAADALLIDAATLKKADDTPAYYYAESADDLTESFNEVLLGILSSETTFTSPAVAVDTFTRTQSRDDVFFAMFEPAGTADWKGNIKKLKVAIQDGQAVVVDANGNPAYNAAGLISDTARTFWGATLDGPSVDAGGAGARLRASVLANRKIRTNTGTGGALEDFLPANIDAAAYGFANDAELYAAWLANDAADLSYTIYWGRGYDVDDVNNNGNLLETRSWILADILHSKPLVINYGALGSFTQANPDLRVVVGTNNGMLHMFGNTDGQEDWAFFPKELGSVLTKRRKNIRSGKNVYGIDAPSTVYTIDVNNDGTLDESDGDKVYLYFGLRRGGDMLYALDLSDPDEPEFMWTISPAVTGFSEMGQTWSVPVVAKIPGYRDNANKPKPVLIFGAGYDPVKDDHNTLATPSQDTVGRGVFIVDAVTGELVWSLTPDIDSAKNMQETGLVHSVAADVTPLDSNGDELIDRIYFADTGGNLWRVDLPGDTLPDSSQDKWLVTKLFSAVEGTRTATTDRRFFNAPDVARTTVNGTPIDAIMIGSGDRTNPIAKDIRDEQDALISETVNDQFYLIRDKHTTPYRAALDPDACADDPVTDLRCDLPLYPSDLYDITPDLLNSATQSVRDQAVQDLAAAQGWVLDLVNDGEKSLASSLTIGGKLIFTTFSPVAPLVGCGFSAGSGRLYIIDLLSGTAGLDCNDDGTQERSCVIGGLIPETPSPFFDESGKIWLLLPPAQAQTDENGNILSTTGNPIDVNVTLPGPYGSYWNREDY
ncbi:MAG: PilC/PilY family type IV pilus protein [Halioglobus sp.]